MLGDIEMKNYFISYTGLDEAWAEWVAWELEANNYTVIIQKWDFRPGTNFVLEMNRAAEGAEKTIAIFSQAYVNAVYTQPEWTQAFVDDATGQGRKLIPVRIEEFKATGLLKSVVYIDLVGKTEVAAKAELLSGLKEGRAKPLSAPQFPGQYSEKNSKPIFPIEEKNTKKRPYIPKIKGTITDLDKSHFIEETYEAIQKYFDQGLRELANSSSSVNIKFKKIDAEKFSAEIYVNGAIKEKCKIWLGSPYHHGKQICYATGNSADNGNSFSDVLTLNDNNDELKISAMMAGASYKTETIDSRNMTSEQSAEYLWSRFISNL